MPKQTHLIKPIQLSYQAPYDWAGIIDFFERHAIKGVETVDSQSYERTFWLDGEMGWLRIQPDPKQPQLNLELSCRQGLQPQVITRLRRQFDLDVDPEQVKDGLAPSPLLAAMLVPGLRLPGCWDGFETAVCIILGQLVSMAQARSLTAELVERYGIVGQHPLSGETIRCFPDAQTLANAGELELRTSGARRRCLQNLAQEVAGGDLSLAPGQDLETFRKQLLKLPGIGPWTAENICLRVLSDPDAFPASDLVLKRELARLPDLNLTSVKPWRGYAAICIWENYLATLRKAAL